MHRVGAQEQLSRRPRPAGDPEDGQGDLRRIAALPAGVVGALLGSKLNQPIERR